MDRLEIAVQLARAVYSEYAPLDWEALFTEADRALAAERETRPKGDAVCLHTRHEFVWTGPDNNYQVRKCRDCGAEVSP